MASRHPRGIRRFHAHRAMIAVVLSAAVAPISAGQGTPAESHAAQARARTRAEIRHLLDRELRTCWYPRTVDRERGGFRQHYTRDWSPRPDDSRFLVYQSRMTWTAAAYAAFDPSAREEFLGYARHGLDYLDTVMRDRERGGLYWEVALDGSPLHGGEKHLYATTFAIYAGARLRLVGKDERALRLAEDAFDWLEAHAHDVEHGGYFEGMARDGTPIAKSTEDVPKTTGRKLDLISVPYGTKSMNAHIHMLEALTELSTVSARPIVRQRLEELFKIVRDRIATPPGYLNLYLTRDWKVIPSHDSFGHDIETAYLLAEAATTLGIPDDAATWTMARALVDHALANGWDEENGGFYESRELTGDRKIDTTKGWWTQAEGLNALALMDEKYAHETDRYALAFQKQWLFIRGHMIDADHGGWYAETTKEGRLRGDGDKASPWKANYHTSRAMMNVVRILGAAEPKSKP